ncbi:hypothetical protein P3L10_014142 [Capsicum annuum]
MASLKQAFLLIAFFVVISVNLSWSPKVMALRNLPIAIAEVIKGKLLLPIGNKEMTCYRTCTSDSDCSDGYACTRCSQRFTVFGHYEYWECSVF